MKRCCDCRLELALDAFYTGSSRCKACDSAHVKAWRENNREKSNTTLKAWRRANPAKVSGHLRRWSDNRPGYKRARNHLRRQRQRVRVPWYASDAVRVYYRVAKALRALGYDVHVGHWVPLRGRNVCGLHVQHNLCLELAHENMSKGARVVPQVEPPLVSRARSIPSEIVQGFRPFVTIGPHGHPGSRPDT